MKNFSVLLPIYDRLFLKTSVVGCLESIFLNSLLPDEVVIVCDGPLSWDLKTQISEYPFYSSIKFVNLHTNVGLANALNIGLQECNNDIIARVDADDFCHPDRFIQQMVLMDRGYNFVGSNIQEIDENGRKLKQRIVPEKKSEIVSFSMRRNPFNHMSMMYSKKFVMKVGGYPEFYLKEDYALWVLMLADPEAKPYNIQKCLMNATAGAAMYSRRTSIRILAEEYKMQQLLYVKLGKSLRLCFGDFIIRSSFFFFPPILKKIAYNIALRNR